MAERVKRVVFDGIQAGFLTGDETPQLPEVVEEWKAEEPTEEWTDWRRVSEKEDADATYYPEYKNNGTLFRTPTIKANHPVRRRTVTDERRLIRRWVDPEQGPMAQVVDVETRTERL